MKTESRGEMMVCGAIHVLALQEHGHMTTSRSEESSRLYRAIRNAALIVGAVRGTRRDSRAGTDLTHEQREILDRLQRRPWLLAFAPLATLRILLRVMVRLLPLAIIILAYVLGMTWAPSEAGREYFSAAAQVIPVLLLALAVESQMLSVRALFVFEPMPLYSALYREALRISGADKLWIVRSVLWLDKSFGWVMGLLYAATPVEAGIAVLFALGYAEWECLSVLASIGDGVRDPAQVSGGILAGLVGVGVVALIGRRK